MTGPGNPVFRAEGDSRLQWVERGVNVGHTVYGGIHFHPAPAAAPARRVPALRVAGLHSALQRLVPACERAATALSVMSTIGPDPVEEEKR